MEAIQRRFRLVGGGEYLMVRKHADFAPFFLRKLLSRRRVAPFSPWPWLVDYVPRQLGGLRRTAEVRADAWYSKRLAPPLVAGWLAAEELDELGEPAARYEAVASERLAELRWLGDVLRLVPPGARVLAVSCSTTVGRELLGAGYDVTFAVANEEEAKRVRLRLERQGRSAPIVPWDELEGSPPFDVALAFRVDQVPAGGSLLETAERCSALVAVSTAAALAADVVPSARQRGILLELSDDDDTALIVYAGSRPGGPVDRSALERVREALARQAARRGGRRRPWVPVPSATWASPD
jgi:hypothetical protein